MCERSKNINLKIVAFWSPRHFICQELCVMNGQRGKNCGRIWEPQKTKFNIEFPAQNGNSLKNVRTRFDSLDDRTHGCRILPYPADTKCASQERATPRCDFSRIAARKTIFLHLQSPPLRLTSTSSRTDNSEIQSLKTWDNILIPAQDATQRRGAATTRREAGLGAKGVTKITMGTRTSKYQDSNPNAQKLPTRRHKRCKPDGREHGDIAHHLHSWQAQPADTIRPYDPCN